MDAKRIVIAIFKTIVSIALIVVIGMFVYRFAIQAYDFGYRIFAEEPVSPEPGLTMSVAIVEGKSVMDVGEILEEKGLIRNHYLFYFQELFSNYHGQLKPGVFELCTAMTPEQMIEIMAIEVEPIVEENAFDENTDYGEAYDEYVPEAELEVFDEDADFTDGEMSGE